LFYTDCLRLNRGKEVSIVSWIVGGFCFSFFVAKWNWRRLDCKRSVAFGMLRECCCGVGRLPVLWPRWRRGRPRPRMIPRGSGNWPDGRKLFAAYTIAFFYRRSLRYSRRLYLLTGPVPLHLSLHFYHIYSFLLFVYVSVVFRFSFFLSFFSSLLSGFSFDVRYASLYDRCQKSFEFKVIQFISFWKFHNSIRAFLCTSIANLRGKYDILIKVGFKF